MPATPPATVLLVHGAYHGAWCWRKTVRALAARDIRAIALDLPFTGFAADARAVRTAARGIGGPIVLCGHSYGGRVMSAAATGLPHLAHLVYVAAPMADERQAAAYAGRGSTAPVTANGYAPEVARARFYNACSADDAVAASLRLRTMPDGVGDVADGLDSRVWRDVPATFVVCARDRAMSPGLQREMAVNARYMVELDADHSPFLSVPEALSDVVAAIARAGQP
jgi:pimeloyl-ACP methyl ester carboxylesterase